MGVEIVVPVAAFTMVFGICAVVFYYRYKSRQDLQLTMRAVIDSGQPLSAELLEELTASLHAKRDDLRRGVICIAVGLAFVCLAMLTAEHGPGGPLLGISAFPLLVGVAYLVLWRLHSHQESSPNQAG